MKAAAMADEKLKQTLDFLRNIPDKADAPKKVFAFNSETDVDLPQLRYRPGLDCAFVLASGPANGPLAMSWSDNGRALAIVDGDAALARLTVLIPPR